MITNLKVFPVAWSKVKMVPQFSSLTRSMTLTHLKTKPGLNMTLYKAAFKSSSSDISKMSSI